MLHFAAGVLESITPTQSQPQLVAMVMWFSLAMLLFMWCKADISERNIEGPAGATVLVGLLAPVGVPYYFFRALPRRSATVATSVAIAIHRPANHSAVWHARG